MQPFSMGFYRGANGKLAHCSLMLHCSSTHVPAFTLCLISHCISYNPLTPSSTGICKSQRNMMFHWDLYQVPLELVPGSCCDPLSQQHTPDTKHGVESQIEASEGESHFPKTQE